MAEQTMQVYILHSGPKQACFLNLLSVKRSEQYIWPRNTPQAGTGFSCRDLQVHNE